MDRTEKGKSLIDFPRDYVILDLETTGLDPAFDEIIEIGAIRVRNGEEVERFNSLVKPSYPVDPYIEELTGLTNAILKTAPNLSEVLPAAYEFIGSDIIVGHNVNFDINFLYDNLSDLLGLTCKNDFVDTLRLSRKLLPELSHHRLSDIAEALGVERVQEHRSLGDCETTYNCFKMIEHRVLSSIGAEAFIKSFKGKPSKSLDLHTLTADSSMFDETHPLYGKVCVFTGALERLTRAEAAQIVLNIGGICDNGVTKKTNFLILGNNDYCPTIKEGKSSKQRKAEEYKAKGQDIEVLTENVFYDLISG